MARFRFIATSAAALAVNTPAAWLMGNASGNARLRRVTVGVITNSATTPTSQQLLIGINRVSTAGATPTAITPSQLDPQSVPPLMTAASAFGTPPTLASGDDFQLPINTQSGSDLPWEFVEEFWIPKGAAGGLAFVNRVNALPTGHQLSLAVEWEE